MKFEHPKIDDVIEKTIATGTINPRQEVEIKPQVSGIVDIIYVEEGDIVKKGQELAKIKLIPSEVSINSAQSNVQLAQLQYQESKRELQRQRQIFDNNLDVDNARLSYENAKDQEERQRQLFDDGVISRQAYDQYKLDVELAKAAFDNASISSNNSLRQFESNLRIREQEMHAAQNNLQLLREGVTNNSKQVSNVILSTLDGMVLVVPVKEGSSVIERNNFNEGTSIATIANMSDLIFEGKVDESDVNKLRPGMEIELKVGAIPDHSFEAILEHVAPKGVIEEGTIKFEVRASIAQLDTTIMLRAGYSANGDIILNTRNKAVTINERDILYKGDSTLVEVQSANGNVEKRLVELGISDGIRVEVVSGVDTSVAIKVQDVLGDNN
jgi:HlyD family secretion protein